MINRESYSRRGTGAGKVMRKRVFWVVVGVPTLVVLLAAVLALNSWRMRSRQVHVPTVAAPAIPPGAAARLGVALRFQTISDEVPTAASRDELRRFRDYLQTAFPHVHAALTREVVNEYSLLYTWAGSDATARPIVLMAHQDVVPIAPGSDTRWAVPPFAGEIRDGFIWGRGAWDDKGNLLAILEAVEALTAGGRRPQRTVYLAFGHDEEIGGAAGAKEIVALLKSRGVRPEFVLDEGLLIADGMIAGLRSPSALIGIAEKGSVTLKITATAQPGHSSMPGARSAIGSLAGALFALERAPFPATVTGVAADMLDTVAPEMSGLNRLALANRGLLGPLIRWQLTAAPATNALLRTTTAITVVRGGNKDNVLPQTAEALVNFRTLPGDSAERVVDHARHVIADPGVLIDVLPQVSEASPVSDQSAPGYRAIARTVRELFPGVIVAPGLMVGGTDGRHWVGVADNVYRFSPVRARPDDLKRFHGTDERISVTNYGELIAFYSRLLENAAGAQ